MKRFVALPFLWSAVVSPPLSRSRPATTRSSGLAPAVRKGGTANLAVHSLQQSKLKN